MFFGLLNWLGENYELSFEPKSIWNYNRNNLLEDICDTVYKEEQLSKGKEDWIKAGIKKHIVVRYMVSGTDDQDFQLGI